MAWTEEQDEHDDEPYEGPDEADVIDEPAEVPCPYCRREIDEEAFRCPYCGAYLSQEDQPRRGRRWWWYVAVALLLCLLLRYLLK